MNKILYCLVGLLGLLGLTQGRVLLSSSIGSRIVNGENAKPGEFPYIVSLQRYGSHFCGGSIINKQWVVSAGHCLKWESPDNIKVLVGTTDLKKPYKYHQVESIIVHKNYSPSDSYKNDISLIKVKVPFEFSDVVKAVPLPEVHAKAKTNSVATISGWGYLMNRTLPNILQKVKVYVADPDHCRKVLGEHGMTVHPSQICANDPSVRKGECNGDSGGPVTVDGVLHGIVSWSIKDPSCGSPTLPGVHTRVSEFIDWIAENIEKY